MLTKSLHEFKDEILNAKWFRKSTNGYGWVPVSYFGWISILLYVAASFVYPVLVERGDVPYNFKVQVALFSLYTAILYQTCTERGEPAYFVRDFRHDLQSATGLFNGKPMKSLSE